MNTSATTAPADETPRTVPEPEVQVAAREDHPAPEVSPPSGGSTWRVVAWLALLLLALAGVILSASLWVRMNNAQSDISRHVGDVLAQQRERQAQTEALQAQVRELQSRLASAEARVSELSLQRGQLEELVHGLSRSRDESLVQDLESSLRQAMASAALSGSVQPLVTSLQVGMARIARTPQPRLNPVQEAMAQDLNDLQQAEVLDVPRAAQQLSSLTQTLDRLPMGMAPAERPSEVMAAVTPPVEPKSDPNASMWRRWGDWVEWKLSSWWFSSRDQLQGLVRVRRVTQAEAVALTPEQAVALGSQLKLRLLGARVALLNGQRDQVLADLAAVKGAVNAFAQLETPEAQAVLQRIEALRVEVSRGPVPRPEHTLQALALASSS